MPQDDTTPDFRGTARTAHESFGGVISPCVNRAVPYHVRMRQLLFLGAWGAFCFCVGRGVELMWPEGSPWAWWGLAILFGAIGVLTGSKTWEKAIIPWWRSGTLQEMWSWARARWSVLCLAALLAWVIFDNGDVVLGWVESSSQAMTSRYDELRTRPRCRGRWLYQL